MKPLFIHQTDLFHSHNDPDDHWDLACQFALAYGGDIELGGIVIDYPPIEYGDPAIQAVSQLNYIAGMSVPVAVGIPKRMTAGEHYGTSRKLEPGFAAINRILDTLANADRPVVIHIVGSCRDLAIAAQMQPDLFREKCRAIYLVAGSSSPDSRLEYNVALDPYSYSVVFGLECPIYWMPCFEFAPEPPEWRFDMGQYGTFYRFMQHEILPDLSASLQNYFLYALGKVTDGNWLTYLANPVNKRLLDYYSKRDRSMYSTGAFFHGAGKTVTAHGEIADLHEVSDPVYSFVPAEIACKTDGTVSWQLSDSSANRYIYQINDLSNYAQAMTKAMKTLLSRLP